MPPLPELLYGPYKPLRVRKGDSLFDEELGWVKVAGIHDAAIPWPYMRGKGRHRLILTGDLARAVKVEAAVVVQAWWGVRRSTLTKWRNTLGVGHTNAGTSERKAASKRGVPRPAHVRELLDWTGKRLGAEHRRKIGEASRSRGAWPPSAGDAWTAEEDAALDSLPPAEVVKKTGRTLSAVYSRRWKRKKKTR